MSNDLNTKKIIQRQFSNASYSYEKKAILQYNISKELLNLFKKKYFFEHNIEGIILDLGCATGKITYEIAKLYSENLVIGVDFSPDMIKYAKLKHSKNNLKFIVDDLDQLSNPELKNNNKPITCKVIFSTNTLQWSISLENSFRSIYQFLSSQGIFAFSIFLNNTFIELRDAILNSHFTLPTYDSVLYQLQETGFSMIESYTQVRKMLFKSFADFHYYQKKTGAYQPFSNQTSMKKIRELNKKWKNQERFISWHYGVFILKKY